MKTKILFITHWYPTKKKSDFGVFIKEHADAIALFEKIDVIHFNFEKDNSFFKIDYLEEFSQNKSTYTVNIKSKFYKYLYVLIPFHFFIFKQIIKRNKLNLNEYKIIHSNVIFPNGILGYYISKKYKLKQVHTEHWTKIQHFFKKSIWRNRGKKTLANIKIVMPVSTFFKQELLNLLDESKMIVVPNVINASKFNVENKFFNPENINLFCLSNWNYHKNPFYFLDALELIYKEGIRNFNLTMAGEGPQLKQVKSNNYSFPIQFIGRISPQEVPDYFEKSNIFLHGSEFETFSVVILESLISGTPIIVSNVGIASEVINSQNGFICSNSTEWYQFIKIALNKKFDYKHIANEFKSKYSAEFVGSEIQKIYQQVLFNSPD
jgi:glycosyltransferase involved in cell wall biosynthesis